MKKILTLAVVMLAMLTLVACGQGTQDTLKVVEKFSAKDIGTWTGSVTSDESAFGTATYNAEGDFTVVKVGAESWGGVESPTVKLDLTKQTYVAIRIKEVNDAFKWTVKFVPDNPLEGHEWGLYVFEDNGMKWNKFVMADINAQFGQDIIDAYNGKIEGKFWIWAVGAADAQVEVLSFTIFQGELS
ncbi:LptM family lipoprotein [Acholeplasma hippikon]|uniref:Uncharacterized protein n=1 Tax=Acholeplasma hippikon TaxID=264636 RepID=A0A449BJ06_9MOLU|nr:hypothetical protein [Acholeplasma hippikon]VEU82422.1 Uncharacterised protein [Acholeplasma hippikon]